MEALLAALADPFRVGLLIALTYTMWRTREVSGVWLPLAAGALFVAALLPLSRGTTLWPAVGVGLVANLIWLAVILGICSLWSGLRKRAN